MTTADEDGTSAAISASLTVSRKSRRYRKRHQRTIAVRVGSVTLGLLVILGAATATLSRQISEVRHQLELTVSLAPQLRAQLADRDYEGAQKTFDQMQVEITATQSIVTGPLWKAASIVPLAGPNFHAVSEVAVSADDVATRAVAPLLEKYESLNWEALAPADGRMDVAQLQEAAPTISSAATTLKLSHERVAAIDVNVLVPQVADPIREFKNQLQGISESLNTASSAAQIVPAMLGIDTPRTYLILVQNSAEARATGGIPGALATLKTDQGRISLDQQSSASALGSFSPPLDVDQDQEDIYTARLGAQMQNVNLTPDFPTAAITAKRMWDTRHSGQSVDGVLALDPVVLGHLLRATGPVALTDPAVLSLIKDTALPKSLNQDNVIATLLSEVYREIDEPAAQDVYFAAVAGEVFAAFANGQGDSSQLVSALTTSIKEHRLYLWSSHRDEQEIIASSAMVGSVVGPESGGATFGVYFNDGTGAKMDYYVDRTAQLVQTCQPDGYNTYTVRLKITNNAPRDAASSLPAYVTGGGVYNVEPGRIRTNYVFYGPSQAFVESASVNGNPVPIGSGKHGLRPVGSVALELGPDEAAELDVVFSHVIQDSEPKIQITPTLASPEEAILPNEGVACD